MLQLEVLDDEHFDEERQEFVTPVAFTLKLQHSLVSLSKWESKFEKPFLDERDKSVEEVLAYIDMMLVEDAPKDYIKKLREEDFRAINAYINGKMTATTFSDQKGKRPAREIVTAELIYHWMFAMGIPKECEDWHLNRLLTLIQVINKKNQPQKKRSKREIAAEWREINAKRRAQYETSG